MRRKRVKVRKPEQSPEPAMRKLLNVADVAELLQVSKSHAYTLMRSGQMSTVRLGRNVRVTEADLQAFIDGQRQEPRQDWRARVEVVR